MSVEVRLRPEAERDLSDASAWYEEQRPGLGQEFLARVLNVFDTLAASPFMYPVHYRQTRRAVLQRYPFGVYYQIDEFGVVVVAVIHASRDPACWQERS